MSFSLASRYPQADAKLPGDLDFWTRKAKASDQFALETAMSGKGGPFGAQLWVIGDDMQPTMIGKDDSNAVVSKGDAGAHAEAENLSLENRVALTNFLEQNRGRNLKIVQVSSGESCPSCRAKQVLFAQELVSKGLINSGDFYVAFKATFERTKQDADFNDLPMDNLLQAIDSYKVLELKNGLHELEATLKADPDAVELIRSGDIFYYPIRTVEPAALPKIAQDFFVSQNGKPAAVVITKNGELLASAIDERDTSSSLNEPEKTAPVLALQRASQGLRQNEDKFDAWNLDGARLVTNIRDLGPWAVTASLWNSLSALEYVPAYAGPDTEQSARELPGVSNRDLFRKVAAPYNDPVSPLRVRHVGNPDEPNVAHLWWGEFIRSSRGADSHYDGKPAPENS